MPRAKSFPWAPLVVALIGACTSLFALRWGLRMHTVIPDEIEPIAAGRAIARGGVTEIFSSGIFTRGVERFSGIVAGVIATLFSGAPAQLRALHGYTALFAGLTVWPTYLLARRVGAGQWYAVAAAALAVAAPWLLYGSLLLTAPVAYFFTTLLAYVLWRGTIAPSKAWDVAIIVVLVLNGVTRAGHLAFFAVPVIVLAIDAWRRRPRGLSWRRTAREIALKFWREHAVLVVAGALGALAVLVVGTSQIVGVYAQTPLLADSAGIRTILRRLAVSTAQLTAGSGIIPIVVGVPWLLRETVRPRSPEGGVFSLIAVSIIAVYVVTSANAVVEDRYVCVVAAMPAIAFAAALGRKEASPLGSAFTAVVLFFLMRRYGVHELAGPFDYFTDPSRTFFLRVRDDLFDHGVFLGVPMAWLFLFTGGLAVLLAMLRSPAGVRSVTPRTQAYVVAAIVALPVIYGAASAAWATPRFVRSAGLPAASFAQNAFIDRATKGRPAAILATGGDWQSYALWNDTAFNESLVGPAAINGELAPYRTNFSGRPDIDFALDSDTGEITAPPGVPRYMVISGPNNVGLAGRQVAASPVFATPFRQRVIELTSPPRLDWMALGVGGFGQLLTGTTPITVFPGPGGGKQCFVAQFRSDRANGELEVAGPTGMRVKRVLTDGETTSLRIPLTTRRPSQRIVATVRARDYDPSAGRAVYLATGVVAGC